MTGRTSTGPAAQGGLAAHAITVAYHGREVIRDLTLTIPEGRVTAIIGPNGCGKSTLLRTLARLHRPAKGEVTLDGANIHAQPTRRVAQRLALLPQAPLAPAGITVTDLVGRGRAPWQGLLRQWSEADAAAVTAALRATGLAELAEERVEALSGGQRQRAWIAMTLAQDTAFLLLDEPTTWLDLPYQIEVLRLLQRLNRDTGRTVVSVLHDLSLAARHSDHMVALRAGRVVAEGTPAEVITPAVLAEAFGLSARVVPDPETGTPLVVPLA